MSDVYEWKDPKALWSAPTPLMVGQIGKPDWCPSDLWSAACGAYDRAGHNEVKRTLRLFGVERLRELKGYEYPFFIRELDAL